MLEWTKREKRSDEGGILYSETLPLTLFWKVETGMDNFVDDPREVRYNEGKAGNGAIKSVERWREMERTGENSTLDLAEMGRNRSDKCSYCYLVSS